MVVYRRPFAAVSPPVPNPLVDPIVYGYEDAGDFSFSFVFPQAMNQLVGIDPSQLVITGISGLSNVAVVGWASDTEYQFTCQGSTTPIPNVQVSYTGKSGSYSLTTLTGSEYPAFGPISAQDFP